MTIVPLELANATKYFGRFKAVDDLSFSIPTGQIIGFLGPNGAGKSTSLRMALGIMNPDAGTVRLFDAAPNLDNLRRVGFLPEERGLYKKMTPRATIAYFARLKGMGGQEALSRADELLETTGLQAFARTKNSKLSKGMAQKVQILATLAHRPDFLILDEPFSGLDPVNQQGLEDLIRTEHARGATIMFSTHVMEHAERLCDGIIMMAKGQKVFDGSLDAAYRQLGRGARIGLDGPFDLATALHEKGFNATLDADEESSHNWWRVALSPDQEPQEALRATIETGAPIVGFTPEEARLRDVFVALAGTDAAGDLAKTPAEEAL